MPAKSQAFARMKAALLTLVRDIPSGRIAEVGAVAIALNIPPRHVAFILSQPSDKERLLVPWHSLVPKGGKFPMPAKRTPRQEQQILALETEGGDISALLTDELRWPLPKHHSNTFWADEAS